MKSFWFIILSLAITGCTIESIKQNGTQTKYFSKEKEAPIELEEKNVEATLQHFSEQIYSIKKGFSNFSASGVNLSNLEKIDTSFLNQYLIHLKINDIPQWNIYHDKSEPFYLFEWEEDSNSKYFTMIQEDESCCTTAYICRCDNNFKPIEIKSLLCDGGDGGWSMYSYAEYNSSLIYKTYSMQLFEDWGRDTNQVAYSTYKNDSSVVQIDFSNSSFQIDTLFKETRDTLVYE